MNRVGDKKKEGSMMNSRPKVLVVDNAASVCLSIATTLQQAGYEVEVGFTGRECLAKIMIFHPQCLVLEALLPDISGYAICRRVRQSMPEQMMSILLMSSKDAPLDKRYGLRQGADRYLPKPFSTETLLREVWQIVPEALRGTVLATVSVTPLPPPQPYPLLELLDLLPQRVLDQEVMRVSSPFVNATTMKDEQARRLYSAIDGKKTVIELAIVTGLEPKDVCKHLSTLLNENRIQIYDSAGQPMASKAFLSVL